ncbi:NUDIX hydrolase [Bacillus ndiopicus]|uniref:NUDIX hydrolase n=1 Tax=Bacillus ndiopicus TaxID=1347368 RepID=UPI0005A87120|nr:NUDIX hydrolase [Bacillus ndiopicus]
MKYLITSACLVLNNEKEILLKKDPKRGWELPGGMVELNETFKEAAVREVQEETGIEIIIERFCGISQELNKQLCNIWWIGKPVSGNLNTSNESLEVGFFSLEQALQLITNEDFKMELLSCYDKALQPFTLFFE